MKLHCVWFQALAGLLLITSLAHRLSGDSPDYYLPEARLENVGGTVGSGNALGISGDNILIAAGGSLRVVDVSNPTVPRVVGEVDTTSTGLRPVGLAISGHHVYVTSDQVGVEIFDIADPKKPLRVGSFGAPLWSPSIAIAGHLAYLAMHDPGPISSRTGLHIFDISSPTNAHELGFISIEAPRGLAVSGGYAFVGSLDQELQVIDVSNPRVPVLTGRCSVGSVFVRYVEVVGRYVYAGGCSFAVIDVSDPSQPMPLSNVDGSAEGLVVVGNRAFAAGGLFDFADPAKPTRMASTFYAVGHALRGDYAFVVEESDGHCYDSSVGKGPTPHLAVYRVTGRSLTQIRGRHLTTVQPWDLALIGTMACLVGEGGLETVNVGDPSRPVALGRIASQTLRRVQVQGQTAYALSDDSTPPGLFVFDLADPSNPKRTGQLAGYWNALAASGQFVFLGGGEGFAIVDVADRERPRRIAHLSPTQLSSQFGPRDVNDVEVAGSYAFLSFEGWTAIVDVLDPSNPKLIAQHTWEVPWEGRAASVSGERLFKFDRAYGGFALFDIRSPAHPVLVCDQSTIVRWRSVGLTTELSVSGDLVFTFYLNALGNYLEVVDVSVPSVPSRVGFGSMPVGRVIVDDEKLLVATRNQGLLILELQPAFRPLRVVDGQMRVSWLGRSTTKLQQTASLHPPDWRDVPAAAGRNSVDLPLASPAGFFRLASP